MYVYLLGMLCKVCMPTFHVPPADESLQTFKACKCGRANADEMAAALQELGTMQTMAAEVKTRILDVDAGLNRVGKAYLHHLTAWQEHNAISASLTDSLQVRTDCKQALYRRMQDRMQSVRSGLT